MTDLTGFGLAIHLRSIIGEANFRWIVDWQTWPGVDVVLGGSERATLSDANERLAGADLQGLDARHRALAVDPQTLGGVIAIFPAQTELPEPWQKVAVLM